MPSFDGTVHRLGYSPHPLTAVRPRRSSCSKEPAVHPRRRAFAFLVTAAVLAGTAVALAAQTSHGARSAAAPKRGGHITIARIEDSQSFDKTNVFQNESIWIAEQINEPLYLAGNDGKTLRPWLATSYTKSPDGKTFTFKLRQGVKFSNGNPMTSADVIGLPFENLTPWRSLKVNVFPSGDFV